MSTLFSYPTTDEIDAVKALTKDDRNALALQINSTPPERLFSIAPDGKPICPICGNGSGTDGTGVDFTEKVNGFLYGCRRPNDAGGQCLFNGLLTNVAAKELGIDVRGNFDGFCTALAAAAKFAGVAVISAALSQSLYQREQKTATTVDKPPKDYSKLYAVAANNLTTFVNRLGGKWRGLPLQFLKKVGAGFSHKNAEYEAGVIFPYTANHYFKRLVNDDGSCISDKGKHPKQHHGKMLTFYRIEDVRADAVVFVTEGEIDALSIKYVSDDKFTAIATGGADGWHDQIANLVKVYGTAAVKPKFAVLFDNDAAGDNGAKGFVEALTAAGFPAKSYHLREAAEKFDANDWLQDNPDALRERLNELHNLATTELTVIAEQMAIRADSVVEKGAGTDSGDTAADGASTTGQNLDTGDDFAAAFFKRGELGDYRKLISQSPSRARDTAIRQLILGGLDWLESKTGTKIKPKATVVNFDAIFTLDPALDELFGYDDFYKAITFLRQAPWHRQNRTGETWTDTDDAELRLYLRRNYHELAHDKLTADMIVSFANRNGFNTAQRWLESLPAWDGTPRAETLFIKYLRVEDSAYAREITLKWLIGAVARIYHPGCAFDFCLVLQGRQGIGKSYLIRRLGGKFYVELRERLDSPQATDSIQRAWMAEIPELSAMRKAELNAVKSFLSATGDTRRFSYDRRATTPKRHVVFAATINDGTPFSDTTGGRRWWILRAQSAERDFVRGLTDNELEQIWAEVLFKFKEKFADGFDEQGLLLEKETADMAAQLAGELTADDGLAGEIAAFLDKPIPAPAIWRLMTREQRRNFIVSGEWVVENVTLEGLQAARRRPEEAADLKKLIDSAQRGTVVQFEMKQYGKDAPIEHWYRFFGAVLREHISAVEVYTELFGSAGDKRRSMRRIAEVLAGLDGWKQGDRLRTDPAYGDQKIVYYRVEQISCETDQEENWLGDPGVPF